MKKMLLILLFTGWVLSCSNAQNSARQQEHITTPLETQKTALSSLTGETQPTWNFQKSVSGGALTILAEPFIFKGSYYLALSLVNDNDDNVVLYDMSSPNFTMERWFHLLVNGKNLTQPFCGAFMIGENKTEIPPNRRFFFGAALLAGDDNADLLGSYRHKMSLDSGITRLRSNLLLLPHTRLTLSFQIHLKMLSISIFRQARLLSALHYMLLMEPERLS